MPDGLGGGSLGSGRRSRGVPAPGKLCRCADRDRRVRRCAQNAALAWIPSETTNALVPADYERLEISLGIRAQRLEDAFAPGTRLGAWPQGALEGEFQRYRG